MRTHCYTMMNSHYKGQGFSPINQKLLGLISPIAKKKSPEPPVSLALYASLYT